MKKSLLLLSAVALLTLASCTTMMQMASLLTCNYQLNNVINPKLAGINLSNTGDLTKLDPVTLLKVSSSLLAGSLPLSATVNVGVTNNNSSSAQMEGLEWALFFEGVNMVSGKTEQQISVAPNGGKSVIPFNVSVDLAELFKGQNKEQMLKFANGLMHTGEADSKVTLKIRPTGSIGGQKFTTGFISISKNI